MRIKGKIVRCLAVGTAATALVAGLGAGPASAQTAAESGTKSCGTNIAGPPGTWSKAHLLNCSIAGSPGLKVTYYVKKNWGSDCAVQVRGFTKNQKKKWYDAGISGKRTVPWGNVWASPAARIKCVPATGHYYINH